MSRTATEQLNDEALYREAVVLGDPYAQHCFTDRFRVRIIGFARQWCDTASLAEEVCAEVLRKVMMPGSPREVTSVTGLLHAATRNTAYTLLERRRRDRERHDATAEYLHAFREDDVPPSLDQLDALVHDTLVERLRQGIAQLRPDQRASVECFYFEDLSYEDIAERLQIPAGAVRSHLQNGRKRLRHLLAPR